MRLLLLTGLMLVLCACCADSVCKLDKRLDAMPSKEAFASFRTLSAQEQVDIYVWELSHSKPVGSRYEFLLKENAEAVAGPLLVAANKSDKYMVQASLLGSLSRLPSESRKHLERGQLVAAVKRCQSLVVTKEGGLCATYGAILIGN